LERNSRRYRGWCPSKNFPGDFLIQLKPRGEISAGELAALTAQAVQPAASPTPRAKLAGKEISGQFSAVSMEGTEAFA